MILGDFGNKTQQLVKGLTKLGRAWINLTQNLKKGLKSTCIMNKSVCGIILEKISLYNFHTIHNQHSSKVWSETEHFENFEFFGPGGQGSNYHLWTKNWSKIKIIMDSWNLESLIRIQSKWIKIPRNRFENGVWIFNQICPKNEISRKSRQFWTKTQLLGCDKINKWYQNLYFLYENLIFP